MNENPLPRLTSPIATCGSRERESDNAPIENALMDMEANYHDSEWDFGVRNLPLK
jgi:hypothetical protein